jgi:hypothetical protein
VGNPELVSEPRYRAFLDLLGFSEIVKEWSRALELYQAFMGLARFEMSIEDHFEPLEQRLDSARMRPKTAARYLIADFGAIIWRLIRLMMNKRAPSHVAWRMISDSIILTSTVPYALLHRASLLQYLSFFNDAWIRGGVGYGLHLEHTENVGLFIVSQALSQAANAEKTASYPRVVLSKDVLEEIQILMRSAKHPFASPWRQLLLQREDGHWCVNPCEPSRLYATGVLPWLAIIATRLTRRKPSCCNEMVRWAPRNCYSVSSMRTSIDTNRGLRLGRHSLPLSSTIFHAA